MSCPQCQDPKPKCKPRLCFVGTGHSALLALQCACHAIALTGNTNPDYSHSSLQRVPAVDTLLTILAMMIVGDGGIEEGFKR